MHDDEKYQYDPDAIYVIKKTRAFPADSCDFCIHCTDHYHIECDEGIDGGHGEKCKLFNRDEKRFDRAIENAKKRDVRTDKHYPTRINLYEDEVDEGRLNYIKGKIDGKERIEMEKEFERFKESMKVEIKDSDEELENATEYKKKLLEFNEKLKDASADDVATLKKEFDDLYDDYHDDPDYDY